MAANQDKEKKELKSADKPSNKTVLQNQEEKEVKKRSCKRRVDPKTQNSLLES